MGLLRLTALALLLGCQMAVAADPEDAPAEPAADPWVGCWSRLYDQAHLKKHPGQLVTAITVAIDPRASSGNQGPGAYSARVAANFRGKPETYTTPYSARCGTAGTDDRLRCFLDGSSLANSRSSGRARTSSSRCPTRRTAWLSCPGSN